MARQIEEKAREAARALEDLFQAALAECGHPGKEPDGVPFQLTWERSMSPQDLADRVLRTAAECVAEKQALRSGFVYCYACASASCAHAQPSAPGEVFAGYESTGRPHWQEFFNCLLALGDQRTDMLFAERPRILARVVGRTRLTNAQLVSFGKNSLTYRIWGQVAAGYFRVGGLRAALTAQFVETPDHCLHMQLVTPPEVRAALAEAPPDRRSALHRVHDALGEARKQAFSLGTLWQATRQKEARAQVEKRAFAVLRHLAHSIERKGRQQRRRTVHAETRGQQRRPVHKAGDDLRRASPGDFFRDTHKGSLIVLGRGGRVHVFSEEGKQVTSLVIGGDELARRQRRKRYVPLEPETIRRLRSTIPDSGAA